MDERIRTALLWLCMTGVWAGAVDKDVNQNQRLAQVQATTEKPKHHHFLTLALTLRSPFGNLAVVEQESLPRRAIRRRPPERASPKLPAQMTPITHAEAASSRLKLKRQPNDLPSLRSAGMKCKIDNHHHPSTTTPQSTHQRTPLQASGGMAPSIWDTPDSPIDATRIQPRGP